MASDYPLEIDTEASPWAGDLLYALAVTLACAHLTREEGLHRGGRVDRVVAGRIRGAVEERIDSIPRMSQGRHHTQVSDPFDPSRPLSDYTWESDSPQEDRSAPGSADRRWEITPVCGYDGSEEGTPPWHRERRLTSAVGLVVGDEPKVGVIATQHSPDGAGEIVAWAEGEPMRRWIWSMYPSDCGPDGVDRWLGLAYDGLRTPEFIRNNASIADLRDIPFDFHRERVAGRAIITGLLASEPPASADAAVAQVLAIRKMQPNSTTHTARTRPPSRSWLPEPPAETSFDPGWLILSPLTRARAHGALLGLLCGARVAASVKPGTPDPNRYRPAWQPEVDQRAAEMGLGPAPPTEMHLRDSFRAALVGAHTIIKNGAYRAEEMLAAYRRAGVYIEPTEHESNWFLPRLIPVLLFAHGVHRVIPADVDIDRYVSDEDDESVDPSKWPREASALSEFLAMPRECVDAEIALTHRISFKTSATLRQLLFGMQRLLLSDRDDPLAGIRFHKSFDPEREVGFQWESDRRGGHLYRDQVAPFFNAPLDELPPQVSNPRGADDADLPPLPRGVGMGKWGDPMGKRGGEVTLGDRTQPPLQEALYDMSFFDFGPRKINRPVPEEATGDFSVTATIENVWYHLSQNLSLLSAVHETMRLGGNTIVPTAMVASVIGGIHGWRGIPHTWITAIDTTELSFTGISGKDLVDGHVAEALIQTGYRWGCRWLHDRGVDVSRLMRKPAPLPEENVDEY